MNQFIKSTLIAFLLVSSGLFLLSVDIQAQKVKSTPYTWKNVQMVGGGFVDGIIFHPKVKGLRYCRTDMGGAYRWNDEAKRWEPMLDWVSYEDSNLMGVESIAVDPSDPDRVYLSCGTYSGPNAPNGAILRSNDRGKTFQRTNVPFKMGGNENGRGNGERLAVDPNNGKIIYLGTRNNGLWRSVDQGVTWNRVDSFPLIKQNRSCGVVFVVFDPSQKADGKTSSIYAGYAIKDRSSLFHSTDGGATWRPLAKQEVRYRPSHAALSSDGFLYVTYGSDPGPSRMVGGSVVKYDIKTGDWYDITPDKPDPSKQKFFGYAGLAVDPQKPGTVIVSSFNRYQFGGEDIFRTTNGGQQWRTVFENHAKIDHSIAQYTSHVGIHWLFALAIDPFDSDHALFSTGYGGHETFDLTDVDKGKPTQWYMMANGIEETVALDLLSPPKGAPLLSAIGDYCGFTHWDLDKSQPEGCYEHPHFGNTNSLACAENKPEVLVRVGIATPNQGNINIGYSLDYGKTWQQTDTMPRLTSAFGNVAISSDGETWIWTPQESPVYVTKDKGKTWIKAQGIDSIRVVADRVNPKKFYGISLLKEKLFVSTDGGLTFTQQTLNLPGGLPKKGSYRGDGRGGQDQIYTTPGKEGDLWIAAFDGLFHSKDSGKTFERMKGVQEIHAFGFGKAAPGHDYSALYLVGVVNGVRGIFRSDNASKKWIRINDDQHQWGLVLQITGDPKQYGRVYVGTHGRGTFYGDPVK